MCSKDNLLIILMFIWIKINFISASNCEFDSLEFQHNYLVVKEPVYDIDEVKIYRYELPAGNIRRVDLMNNYKYATVSLNGELEILLQQINEKTELTKSPFFYNFTISFDCDHGISDVPVIIPLIDTNNNEPFFDKPSYTYNLFSTFPQDFMRLQEINPIAATDYDVTNQELVFIIQKNDYFDIQYDGIVPGTLNKKHFAKLVPKKQITLIKELVDLKITVTDTGYPPLRNTTRLVIKPPSPPKPVFDKTFYVGHYYKNHSFIMLENPKLLEGVDFYKTNVFVLNDSGEESVVFRANIDENKISIEKLSDNFGPFYEYNYSAYVLEAYYTDEDTGLYSIGKSTFIVELHHHL